MAIPCVQLASGISMPQLGMGLSHRGGFARETLVTLLHDKTYTALDTATRYGNEEEVGTRRGVLTYV